MGPKRGIVVVVLVALAALLLAMLGTASGSGVPSIPGVPNIPTVKLPPPDQKAVFDVIVEGKATDINHSELSGKDSTCLVTERGDVTETDTYLRGKDVKLEFARYGHTIVVKRNRGGALGDTSLAVKVTVHRTASGGTTYKPYLPNVPCDTAPTDISKNADCGKNIPVPGSAMVLGWRANQLSLTVSPNTVLKTFTNDRCGDDPTVGITDTLFWAWPKPVGLKTASLHEKWLFDARKKTIVVHLGSSFMAPAKKHRDVGLATLKGFIDDTGYSNATVRLIRQRG